MSKPTRKRKLQPVGIMVVLEDGPHRCLVPIPRSDLAAHTPEFTLPYWFGTVKYRLESVDANRVHHYVHVPADTDADADIDLPDAGTGGPSA